MSLVVLKILAFVISGSVAMLASLVDSCLDLLSGAVLFFTRRAIDHTDPYDYPEVRLVTCVLCLREESVAMTDSVMSDVCVFICLCMHDDIRVRDG